MKNLSKTAPIYINTSYFLRAAGASENTRARAKRVQRGLSANGHLGQNGGPKKAGPNQCMLRCFPSGRWSKWGVQKNVTKSILSRAISIRPAGAGAGAGRPDAWVNILLPPPFTPKKHRFGVISLSRF